MKTFKRTSLPETINYNGEVYTINTTISGSMSITNVSPQKVIEAVRSTGLKGVIVEVLSHRLKGKTDLWGKPYKPSKWIYTNKKG